MKQIALVTILLSVFSVANADTTRPSLDKSELIGVAVFNDQNTAHEVCFANKIVDERCESGEFTAVTIGAKFTLKGSFGAIVLIKRDHPSLAAMNFKNIQEGRDLPFVKIKLPTEVGKPAEFVEVVKNVCFWSIDPSNKNPSGGAVCEKLGFDYQSDSKSALLLKNPNGQN